MGVYVWKDTARFKGDVQRIGEELESIPVITPEAVVKKAQSKRSALHNCFTWDNEEAAGQWRMQEARMLINAIVTVEDPESTEPMTYPTYESVVINEQRQYVRRDVWSSDAELKAQIYAQIGGGISALQNKAATYRYLDKEGMDALQERLAFAKEAVTA